MARSGRLLHLVNLLSGPRARTVEELARRLEVSVRTTYRDLAELDRHRVPLARDERGYRLLEGATLRPLDLTAEERALLRLALENPALSGQPGLRRPLDRLRAKLDAVTAAVEETPEALRLTGVERSGVGGEAVMAELAAAIRQRRQVEILYSSLSGGTRRFRGVDPYRLFHRDGVWYLAGRCHVHDEVRTFRLDRIAEVRSLGLTFAELAGFDFGGYLEGAWSVYRGGRRHRIVLRFERGLAPLVTSAVHHEGEEVEELESGEIEYRVRLSHLDEIARWILGFGGRCRVVKPEALRRRVVGMAREAATVNRPG